MIPGNNFSSSASHVHIMLLFNIMENNFNTPWEMNIMNSHLAQKYLQLIWKKVFGKEVCKLVFRCHKHCLESSILHFFSNKVKIDFDVFCSLMKKLNL